MSIKGVRPLHGADPRELPEENPAGESNSCLKKRRQRARARERAIAAGKAKFRVQGGIRHPLDCPCYDCLYGPKV